MFVVAACTDRSSLDSMSRSLTELHLTLPALETVLVIVLAGELEAGTQDHLATPAALLTKHIHVTGLAVVLTLLLPVDGVQQRAAVVTLETTSVKLLPVHDKFGV